MKTLLIRHGYDDFDIGEQSMGRGQMVIAADVLKSTNLVGDNGRIVASGHKRTMASAQVIADELGIPGVEEVSWLTDGTEDDPYYELMRYLDTCRKETIVIAVTHLPEIERILTTLEQEYKTNIDMDAGYGDMYLIDTKKKRVEKVDVL